MPHIHDKIDLVEAYILNNKRVLLRKHDKYKTWLGVGGHIKPNEDKIEAVIRVAKEETGLDVVIMGEVTKEFNNDNYRELLPPRFMNWRRTNEAHEHITHVYFARLSSDKIKNSGSDVSEEYKWFTREELNDPAYDIRDNVKSYANKALEIYTLY